MKPVEVLALGKYSPDDLLISVTDSNRKIEPTIESQIDVLWEEKKKKAEAEGRICYNGISYRLNSLMEEGNRLVIEFGTLEYKAREALPTIPGYFDLPEQYYRKGCYSGASVRTSDHRYLIVELSGKSMNMNATDLLGGIMEKPQEIANGEDVFTCQYVELEEEACIRQSDIEDFYLRAIYMEPKTNVGFYFEVILNVSSEDLLKRFEHETKDQDIKSLKALTREEYLDFLNNHAALSKQVIPTLLQI